MEALRSQVEQSEKSQKFSFLRLNNYNLKRQWSVFVLVCMLSSVLGVNVFANGNPVNPEDFTGTDYEKLQQAFNSAVTNERPLQISKTYNMGASTITINKASDERKPLFIFGGGKIIKDTTGYMFQGNAFAGSDILFENISFQGVENIEVNVFDCRDQKLIRLTTTNCHFDDLHNIFYSDTFVQTIKMNHDTIVRCSGAVFDIQGAFNINCNNITAENCTGSFIKHGGTGVCSGLYNTIIRDCILEGFSTSPVFDLKNVANLVIDGCYFELNTAGIIVFSNTSDLTGVTISNNIRMGNDGGHALIKWGNVSRSCVSAGNVGGGVSAIHDTTNVASGIVVSENDYHSANVANIDPNNKIYNTTIDLVSQNIRKIGDTYSVGAFTVLAPDTNWITVCSIRPYIHSGGYITIRGGGLQANFGSFGINKTFKVTRYNTTITIVEDVNDSWGDFPTQKNNIQLIASGTDLLLQVNSKNTYNTRYDLSV